MALQGGSTFFIGLRDNIRKIIINVIFLFILVIVYVAGLSVGSRTAIRRRINRDLMLHKELVALDRSFLTNVATRPNTLISGNYILETQIAGKPAEVSSLRLEVSKGQLTKLSQMPIQDIRQTGNVVSWERFDIDERPRTIYIGMIDGNRMWGKIYTEPGQGWHEGESPNYGMWRLYPKPE